jgi:hypothetical protein
MDNRLLRLKMEILYRGMPIEQGQKIFEEIKTGPLPPSTVEPKVKVRRKLRIAPKE